MFPKRIVKPKMANSQHGSALVIAIFIIVVMTLLGASLVRMTGSNAETIVYEVLGTRAYQAAQAGAQRKMSEVFPLSGSGSCSVDSNYADFITVEGLENCQALDVDCVADAVIDAGTVDEITYYTITSIGQCSVAGVVTSRTIEIKARSL